MAKPAKSVQLLEKSVQAAVAAIEVYNKPDFKYREESFCILMANAWELLLKAKLLAEAGNDVRAIYVKEKVLKRDGTRGSKEVYKKNRCGNEITIELFRTLDVLSSLHSIDFDRAYRANLELLIEIRDNAVHFYHTDPEFTKKVLEVGTASLRNYVTYVQAWFDYDLSKYNFFLMPISFFHGFEFESFSVSRRERQMSRLLRYIEERERECESEEVGAHNVTLTLETRFVKSKAIDAAEVRFTDNPNAPAVRVSEEDVIASRYPLNYKRLSDKLRARYTDFKMDAHYHRTRKVLEENSRFCRTRLLDPQNPKGTRQKFYSTEILKEFDKEYTKL